jgi:hypothetical protein
MSIASVNRTLQTLRSGQLADFASGQLAIKNWRRLVETGQFDPHYLHLKKAAALKIHVRSEQQALSTGEASGLGLADAVARSLSEPPV